MDYIERMNKLSLVNWRFEQLFVCPSQSLLCIANSITCLFMYHNHAPDSLSTTKKHPLVVVELGAF